MDWDWIFISLFEAFKNAFHCKYIKKLIHFLYNNYVECFSVSYWNLHKYAIQEMFLQTQTIFFC
jgi:hypothetical protein